ncbi:hypothetical protein [Actinoplanes regularis]|uniref:Uncharacterized protein n=1 Tax=Actinoplanes regularis TaxID=52697 RepID=A0A238W2S7_9ACTN|nr:hypothetical protein [Actinoplanes regularis]GIE85307.1 hypothetical protein Are01nite_17870 [Actinoplanes regularis]SNR40905.1 hypothetical protein SAMN06264365_102120 [Actinoplanes regularis]
MKHRYEQALRGVFATAAVLLATASSTAPASGTPRHPATGTPTAVAAPTRYPAPPYDEDALVCCARTYSPAEVAELPFSFDGTVVAIASPSEGYRYQVTFEVHQWFRGGGGDRVTVTMRSPSSAYFAHFGRDDAGYELGTRLLVSAYPEPRPEQDRQRQVRRPLEDLNLHAVWGCGGFTRPYDPQDAALWAEATR